VHDVTMVRAAHR